LSISVTYLRTLVPLIMKMTMVMIYSRLEGGKVHAKIFLEVSVHFGYIPLHLVTSHDNTAAAADDDDDDDGDRDDKNCCRQYWGVESGNYTEPRILPV